MEIVLDIRGNIILFNAVIILSKTPYIPTKVLFVKIPSRKLFDIEYILEKKFDTNIVVDS